mmetsp:Transcript_24568/g.60241  ORF Transcript_24568/g.60241 Transcript_24568/m.60241 type:complete len:225 (-) Transcript_24568:545-1219(-)
MNTNAYTFLYTSALCSGPFLIAGVVTSLIQYTVFSLFLLDLLNTTSIPPGVTALVRACQAIAIIIAFLVETDMLRALRAVFYSEGFDEMANAFHGFAPWKFSSLGGWEFECYARVASTQQCSIRNYSIRGWIFECFDKPTAIQQCDIRKSPLGGWEFECIDITVPIQQYLIWNHSLRSWEVERFGRTHPFRQCFNWYHSFGGWQLECFVTTIPTLQCFIWNASL